MDSTTTETSDSTANPSNPHSSILTLNNDILLLICTTLATSEQRPRYPSIHDPSPLKLFSATCKRLRSLASPLIFRNVKLGGHGWVWAVLHSAVTQARQSEVVQRHTKRLSVSLYTTVQDESQRVPPEGMFFEFLEMLKGIGKLERLDLSDLSVPEEHLKVFKAAFEPFPHVKFENVKALAISCAMPWMVEKFPNLRSLQCRDMNGTVQSPIESIRRAPGIQHLECRTQWTPQLLAEMREAAPRIKTLAMQSSRPRYSKPIFDFIPTLAQFEDLRCLVLAQIGYLRVGFTAPRCGNAYMGPNGAKVRERVKKERERWSGIVAEAVFGKCKRLEEVWIGEGGNCRATCVRGGDGAVKEIQWSSGQWLQPAGRF